MPGRPTRHRRYRNTPRRRGPAARWPDRQVMRDVAWRSPPRQRRVPGGGNNDRVTAAPTSFDQSRVHSLTRPNMVSVGTIIWLSSELMFFAALFAMYFSIRAATGPAF